MFKNNKILAIIGARGGSKGLVGKNIRPCAGKPLLHWTIYAAIESKFLDKILVSTDSEEIKQVSEDAGIEVPFLRPDNLATDEASIEDVIADVVKRLEELNELFDYVVLLQPTSPLRNNVDIDEAIEQFFENKKSENESLVSVYKAQPKTAWIMRKNENDYVEFALINQEGGKRRQDLESYFYPNGAIYILPINNEIKIYQENVQYFEMPEEVSIDIDYIEDFEKAEEILLSRL